MEIFVRPMWYKGCHQADNAKVVICALFTTPNCLKLQKRRKAFSPIRKVRAISQKLYSHHSRQIPSASDASSRHTSRGFLLWRFAYAGPVRAAPPSWGRHPQTFTQGDSCGAASNALFDHLVGTREQHGRNGEAERPREAYRSARPRRVTSVSVTFGTT